MGAVQRKGPQSLHGKGDETNKFKKKRKSWTQRPCNKEKKKGASPLKNKQALCWDRGGRRALRTEKEVGRKAESAEGSQKRERRENGERRVLSLWWQFRKESTW